MVGQPELHFISDEAVWTNSARPVRVQVMTKHFVKSASRRHNADFPIDQFHALVGANDASRTHLLELIGGEAPVERKTVLGDVTKLVHHCRLTRG